MFTRHYSGTLSYFSLSFFPICVFYDVVGCDDLDWILGYTDIGLSGVEISRDIDMS